MRLIADLERMLAQEESLFRAQLLREDIARLRKLQAMASGTHDEAAFLEAAMRIGWTQGDARTAELREPLQLLLAAVYAFEKGARDAAQEMRIVDSWRNLSRVRMERMVGCLTSPVPKPAD